MADEKFSEIYNKYKKLMLHAAYDILQNQQDAEDALQDAFVKILENLGKLGDTDSPKTRSFVMVVTRNISFNKLRRRRFESGEDIDELNAVSDCSVEDQAFTKFETEQLESALRQLRPELRDILYITVYEEIPLPEASQLLGITYEAAKSRVRRARKKLSDILNKG